MPILLKIGDRAGFTTADGRLITGKVVSIQPSCYLVSGDCGIICATYKDGLFRFVDSDVRREDRNFRR